MNSYPGDGQTPGIATAHGIAGLVVLAVALILFAHIFGFRVIFTGGRPA